jgi:hypothetical protein
MRIVEVVAVAVAWAVVAAGCGTLLTADQAFALSRSALLVAP